MNKFWIILKSVYKRQVMSGGFLAMVFGPIIFIALMGLIIYVAEQADQNSNESTGQTVAVIANDEDLVNIVEGQIAAEVDTGIETVEQADEALANESIDAYATIDTADGAISANVISASSPLSGDSFFSQEVQTILTAYQKQLVSQSIGLSQEELVALEMPAQVTTESVTIDNGEISQTDMTSYFAGTIIAYILVFVMYFIVLFYASIIATEVASEKGMRVMEIILSSTTATAHFFGKVIGVFLVCMTQLAVYALLFAVAIPLVMQIDSVASFINEYDIFTLILDNISGLSILFFIVGIITYVLVSAFLGSLATKPEDASTAITPITLLSIVGIFGAVTALSTPDITIVKLLSHIPFFSPFVMPMRISAGTVPTTEVVISLLISIVTMFVLGFISVSLYRSNVLVYSNKGFMDSVKQSYTIWQTNRKASQQ